MYGVLMFAVSCVYAVILSRDDVILCCIYVLCASISCQVVRRGLSDVMMNELSVTGYRVKVNLWSCFNVDDVIM